MSPRTTVTELHVEATLRVDVPIDRGDELAAAAQDVLESVGTVRYADVAEIGDVDAGDEALAVAVECRLTLHAADVASDDAETAGDADEPADAATVRRSLLEDGRVLGLERFEVVDPVPNRSVVKQNSPCDKSQQRSISQNISDVPENGRECWRTGAR